MENYQDINAKTIDRWVEEGWEWGKPISHEEYVKATRGEWEVLLTPTVNVPEKRSLANKTPQKCKLLRRFCSGAPSGARF